MKKALMIFLQLIYVVGVITFFLLGQYVFFHFDELKGASFVMAIFFGGLGISIFVLRAVLKYLSKQWSIGLKFVY